MKKLYIPSDESELVFLKSVLEAGNVPFYVQNENFGSLYSGAYMNYFNAKTIMVPEDYYDEAKEIIKSVIKDPTFVVYKEQETPAVSNLLKNIFSLFTLGLYSPGDHKKKKHSNTDN